jgi:MFS family permease
LGILEGVANSLSHITTLLSGWFVDRYGRSKQVAVTGYGLSAFLRPLIAIPIPMITFAVRIFDRIGKGIRTAPRDHLLTDSLKQEYWGRAFGIQRGMDHAGALIAPSIATLLLATLGLSISKLFLWASIPAILSILLIPHWIRPAQEKVIKTPGRLAWNKLPRSLKHYLVIIFISALSTPSELFFILRFQEIGLSAKYAPLAFGLMTLCTLLASFFGGALADRWSKRRTLAVGWGIFALVFVGFAFNTQIALAWVLIALFGFQTGLVEPAERAYPVGLVPASIRASTFGWFYFAYGIGLLPASVIFGFLWRQWSPQAAFLIYAGLTVLTIPLLKLLPSDRPGKKPGPQPPLSQLIEEPHS